jgi:hypothetical protein
MKIIVSRFNECVEWTKKLENVIIYNKGNQLCGFFNSKTIENVGREGHTYYSYIYDNYHSLDDFTVFLQGFPFDHSPNVIEDILSFSKSLDFLPLGRIFSTFRDHCFHHYGLPSSNVYNYLFDDNFNYGEIEFTPGAQFIVSKRFILSRPRSFYLKIVNLLSCSVSPIEGYVIERFHRIILDCEYKKNLEQDVK